jgi:small subunit ribosomal protein S18
MLSSPFKSQQSEQGKKFQTFKSSKTAPFKFTSFKSSSFKTVPFKKDSSSFKKEDGKKNPEKKRRIYPRQILKSAAAKTAEPPKIKKSLKYIFFLKKYKNKIDYKNIKLLKAFITKYAKIKGRRKTRIKVHQQRKIAKAIRKARVVGLLPFTCEVKF